MITVEHQVHDDEGLFCPIYACDVCGKHIEDLSTGVADFDMKKRAHVEIRCKGECALDRRYGTGWMPLSQFHAALTVNSSGS